MNDRAEADRESFFCVMGLEMLQTCTCVNFIALKKSVQLQNFCFCKSVMCSFVIECFFMYFYVLWVSCLFYYVFLK